MPLSNYGNYLATQSLNTELKEGKHIFTSSLTAVDKKNNHQKCPPIVLCDIDMQLFALM